MGKYFNSMLVSFIILIELLNQILKSLKNIYTSSLNLNYFDAFTDDWQMLLNYVVGY